MSAARLRLADTLRAVGTTVLGIILALIPPALWVAWTADILLMVVAVGAVSAALLVLLTDFGEPAVEDGRSLRAARTSKALSDEAIAEIHRIFPLTYHHSLVEKARFRRAMEKVRRLIETRRA